MLTNDARALISYRLAGSAYKEGYYGSFTSPGFQLRLGTMTPFIGQVISLGYSFVNTLSEISGSYLWDMKVAGTTYGTILSYQVFDNQSPLTIGSALAYGSLVGIWSGDTTSTLYTKYGVRMGTQSPLYYPDSTWPQALTGLLLNEYSEHKAGSLMFERFSQIIFLENLSTYVVASLVSSSISADSLVATCIFGGSNTSGWDVNPIAVWVYATYATAGSLATRFLANPPNTAFVDSFSKLNRPETDLSGCIGIWNTITKNETVLATIFFTA